MGLISTTNKILTFINSELTHDIPEITTSLLMAYTHLFDQYSNNKDLKDMSMILERGKETILGELVERGWK